jgi:hypothetical protein
MQASFCRFFETEGRHDEKVVAPIFDCPGCFDHGLPVFVFVPSPF